MDRFALSRRRGNFRLLLWHRRVFARVIRLDVHVCNSSLNWLDLRSKPTAVLLLDLFTTSRLDRILVPMLVILWFGFAFFFNLF